MSETLRNCPHCGSEAHTPTQHWGTGTLIPRCKNPACLAEAKDVEAWNRRAPGPATAKLLAWHRGEIMLTQDKIDAMEDAFVDEHEPAGQGDTSSDPERRASETDAINRSWDQASAERANATRAHSIGFLDGAAWAESRHPPRPFTAKMVEVVKTAVGAGNVVSLVGFNASVMVIMVDPLLADGFVAEHKPAKAEAG